MLMMCWFYCIPFAKGLFFASAPLIVIFSLFVLKRGIRQSRPGLRQFAFLLMFVALVKLCTVDIYLSREYLCAFDRLESLCTGRGFKIFQASGLALLAILSMVLFNLYRGFIQNKKQRGYTPEEVRLPLWANLSVSLVFLLILWLAAPWAGYLTVGHVPKFFTQIPWQHLAVLTFFVLLMGFWKLEDCIWVYDPAEKTRKKYQLNVWTAKDTLWVSVVLFLITLAFSYASNDVLSAAMPQKGEHLQLQMDDLDFGELKGFSLPQQ
jgi:hypothetical protein